MLKVLFSVILATSLVYLVLVLRSFEYMSEQELKRQARSGNKAAQKVYQVKGMYGAHVFIVLWALIGLGNAALILLLDSYVWVWLAVFISVAMTVLVHAVVPWSRYPRPSLTQAAQVSPLFARVLALLKPLLQVLEKVTGAWVSYGDVRRIHSHEELLEIIGRSHITGGVGKDEVSIALHALTFGEKTVTEIMTPRSVVKMLKLDEELSPIALHELHESGFSRFPVVGSAGSIVGVLYMKDLIGLKKNSQIRDVMRSDVFFVNEFNSIDHVLNAFLRTKHHLFMVVNEFEEVTGIVTIEDVIEQILGKKIVDEFDQYSDMRLVASQKAALQKTTGHLRPPENMLH